MFDPHEGLTDFLVDSDRRSGDTPGFLDNFLYELARSWSFLNTEVRKGMTKRREFERVASMGFLPEETRELEVSDQLISLEAIGATEFLDDLTESELESFNWVKTKGDFRAQEQALTIAREDTWLHENRSLTGRLGEVVGKLVDPVSIIEFGAIGKGVGALSRYAKPAAQAFTGWANRTFGTSLEFMEIVSGEAAKRVLGAAGHAGATTAIYSYFEDNMEKYIGIPVENIGSNMVWNGLLGACLGGVGGYLAPHIKKLLSKNRKGVTQAFGEKVLNDFSNSEVKVEWSDIAEMMPKEFEGTLNTEAFQKVYIDGDSKFSKYFGYIPTVQGLRSKSLVIRKITDAFFRHQYFEAGQQGSISGVSSPVESEMTQWMGLKYRCLGTITNHFKEFKKRGYGGREVFNEELSRAMLSGDSSSNHIISGCAASVRKEMKTLANEAVEHGVFENMPEVTINESYMPRIYDIEKIRSDSEGWERTFREAVKKTHPEYSEGEIRAYFEDVTDTIKGLDVDEIPTVRAVQGKSKVTKSRRVDLESLDLLDYLVKEPERLMDVYFTGLGFEAAEKRVLRELGYETFAEAYDAAKQEFHEISRTLSGEERNKFEKQAERDLEFLKKVPKLITGQISSEMKFNIGSSGLNTKLNNTINFLSRMNSTTLLGKLGLSCIEDLSITSSERGLFRHIGELWRHKFGDALEVFSKEDLHKFGIAVETLSGNIQLLSSASKATKFSAAFWKATGAPQLDDFRARVISSITSQEIARNILKGEKFTTRLNVESLNKIRGELQRHAIIGEHGIEDMNISAWDSFDAKRDFMAEVERQVRLNIPNPGAGDIPPFFKSPIGKLTTMFTGWYFSLTNQVILPLIRSGKWEPLAKLITYGYGLSFLTNIIRGYIRGKPYKLDEKDIYIDSFTRMPLGIFLMPIDLGLEIYKGVRGSQWGKDVLYTIAKQGSLRWIVDSLNAAGSFAKGALKGSITEREIRKLNGVVPFFNLAYVNPILNYFTNSEGEKK